MESELPKEESTNNGWRALRGTLPVTQAEIAESLTLSERELKGEYVLTFERPISRRADERTRTKFSEELASRDNDGYDSLFREFGLSDEESDHLKRHAAKITRAALEAESSIYQVKVARKEFDARLQHLLSPEQYNKFRTVEAEQPARMQLTAINEHLNSVGQSQLNQAIHDPMVELLQRTGTSFEWMTHHKPYDDLPDLQVGMENVTSKLHMKRTALVNGSSEVLARLESLGVAHELIPHIGDYFSARIARIDRRLNSLRGTNESK